MTDDRIDEHIGRAHTLRGRAYCDEALYDHMREAVLARSWQLIAHAGNLPEPGFARPFELLPGSLDEPLLLTRDGQGELRCMSNVCTHRGNLVCLEPAPASSLRCGYHGRRFDSAGRCSHMPEFEGVSGFPSEADHLPTLPLERWGPFLFTAMEAPCAFEEWIGPVRERVGFVPLERLQFDPATSRDYEMQAHWALYCDNYLEGFHIPFVHPELNQALSFADYETETLAHGVLQVGIASEGEPVFDLPAGHPDAGRRVAAYYYFLFPGLMLNFYPWGLSINIVEPLGVSRTRVRFQSWVLDESKRDQGAGAALHLVEMQDEEVVQQVQRGVRSRLYDRGRYSPSQERGVHRFHRLLSAALAAGE